MKTARLISEWHGVPAGTELVIERPASWYGPGVVIVRRADGAPLPGPFALAPTAAIAAEFIEEIAA